MIADLAVVGGGPVGLAVAIEARLAGLDVAVLESHAGALDKACGEGLMPGAVADLRRWGVEAQGAPIAGFRYCAGRLSVAHRLSAPGLGVRRVELHRAMAARADALGVRRIQERVRVVETRGDAVRVGSVRARYAVAADGLHSALRRSAGLERPARGPVRFGFRRHLRLAPWSDLVEVHWTREAEIYLTPVGPDLLGVGVLGPRGTDFARVLERCAPVAARLAGAEPADALRGAGPLRQRTSSLVAGRLALVGDAAGYVDALTGEGLAVGFASARAVVASILDGGLEGYERRWRRATREPRLITAGVLRLAASPLRPAVVPLASAAPWLYGALIDRIARPAAA